MQIPRLSPDIVQRRQSGAPRLVAVDQACQDLRDRIEAAGAALGRLEGIDSGPMRRHMAGMAALTEALDRLAERARLRHRRFDSGLITVSVAGLEKAGKTSFLRSLTGVDALPAFDERCTAVRCEIHYDTNRSDFDIEFYTEAEFLDRVLRPVAETVAADLPESAAEGFRVPESAAEFIHTTLPSPGVLPGGTTAYKLLTDLRRLQRHFDECRAYLGKPPLLGRPLSELPDWVSHRRSLPERGGEAGTGVGSDAGKGADAGARSDAGTGAGAGARSDVGTGFNAGSGAGFGIESGGAEAAGGRHLARLSAAKVCRLHTGFTGGSPQLRWIDTPGVDDPNRRARDLTLSTIASDTDLLVVVSRPGATPSPGESFHRFWDSVSRLPDEIDLMNRLLFVLNWDKRVDPDGENIRIHKRYLIDAGVPAALFAGPFEAISPEDAVGLMDRVNAHLAERLPDQDARAIERLEGNLKHLSAKARLIRDALAATHPGDADLQDAETEAFHRWFHWYDEDRDTGFWTSLVTILDRSARSISEAPRIQESEASLNAIFAEEAEAIQARIPGPADLEDFVVRNRGENPIPHGMRTISTLFSRLVNRLANEVQEFGPFMQDELIRALAEAGLGPLLKGETIQEKLTALLAQFQSRGEENPIVEVLRETLELPRNLKYVLRYELRGAVDFCDPTLWDENETAHNRLRDMMVANRGDLDRMAEFPTFRHPPVTESRQQDSELLKRIAGNAMLGIHAVLNNERYLPRRIADDFMRDCRVRLCFAPDSEQQWRMLLFRNRGALLPQAIGRIRAGSERIRAFRQALDQLGAALP